MASDTDEFQRIQLQMQQVRSRVERSAGVMHSHTVQLRGWKDQLIHRVVVRLVAAGTVAATAFAIVRLLDYRIRSRVAHPTNEAFRTAAIAGSKQAWARIFIARLSSSLAGWLVPLVVKRLTNRLAELSGPKSRRADL